MNLIPVFGASRLSVSTTSTTKNRSRIALMALAGTILTTPLPAMADPASLILDGRYIKIGINPLGTLGYDGGTSPGILYDGTGTGTFNSDFDYLTPGTAFEGFTVSGTAGSAFSATNNNDFSDHITGTLTSYDGVAHNGATYANRAVWVGTYAGIFQITNDYYFDDDGQQLKIATTITALTDITGLSFARFTDPDATAADGDSSETNNFQGSGSVPTSDLVYAEALVSKYVIGLYSNDPVTHNSAVTDWTADTASYLAGASIGNGDNTIGMGFNIGSLLNGSSITLIYQYIFGTDIAAAIAAGAGGKAKIDTGATSYTTAQLAAGTIDPVFDGGTLSVDAPASVSTPVSITPAGGTINTSGNAVTMTGAITGNGTLSVTGGGTVTLTGNNSHQGATVTGSTLAFSHGGALGADNAVITIGADGRLTPQGDASIAQQIVMSGANAQIDTGAGNLTVSGAVSGDNCLIKAGTGQLNLVAAGSNAIGACIRQGTLSFNNVFDGNVTVDSQGTAGGAGSIRGNVTVNGRLAPGNSPGQLIVTGSVTQTPGSTLAIDVDGYGTGSGAGNYDTLVLKGASGVFTADGTVAPITRGITGAANNSFTPAIGDVFQIVTAEGGVTGSFDSVTQPTNGLPADARFDVIYTANTVRLIVTPGSYGALFGNSGSLNARAFAVAADQVRGAPGASNATNAGVLHSGLFGLGTAELGRVFAQASGEVHASSMDAVVQNSRATRASVFRHLDSDFARHGGDATVGRGVWGEVTGDFGKVRADARAQDYRTDNYAMVIGTDRAVTPDLLLGAAFAYGRSDLGTDWVGSAETSSYHGMAYAAVRDGASYLNAVFAAGIDSYKIDRSVALATGDRALTSRPDGFSIAADIEAGHRYALGGGFLTLAVGIAHDRIERDDFTEQGDVAVALRFDEGRRAAWAGRMGARIDTTTRIGSTAIAPHAALFVTRELSGDATRLDPLLHGARFAVEAPSTGKTGLKALAGISAALSKHTRFNIGYRFGHAGNADSHAANAGISINW